MVLTGGLQEAHVHGHVGHARNFHSVSRIKAHQHNTINPENEGNTTHLTKTFALYISRVKFIRHYTLAQVICSTYFSYLQHTYKSSSIPSPTHSFIPGLKPSFSANPSHRPFLLQVWLHKLPADCLPILLIISVFYYSVFLFLLFSCWFHAVE